METEKQSRPLKSMRWGETPWDDLPKEQLLREVQRMFSALESAMSVLKLLKATDAHSAFWEQQGSGGRALGRASQVVDAVYETYDDESVYRSFFRYAASLLFDVADEERWIICPTCGNLWNGNEAMHSIGAACQNFPRASSSNCPGVLRWLEWKDLSGSFSRHQEEG